MLTSSAPPRPLVFIPESSLIDGLSNCRHARIVTLTTRTDPHLLAKHPLTGDPNPLYRNCLKVSKVNGMIGWRYASAVNRQRRREGNESVFRSFDRKWGKRIPFSPFVEHEGKMYLEMKVERTIEERYETLDGKPIDTSAVEEYLPKRTVSRQGVKREIELRDYALANIITLKVEGVTYAINRDPAAAHAEPAQRRRSA